MRRARERYGVTTMAVHWLNNKELVFSQGAEKLLANALLETSVVKAVKSHTIHLSHFYCQVPEEFDQNITNGHQEDADEKEEKQEVESVAKGPPKRPPPPVLKTEPDKPNPDTASSATNVHKKEITSLTYLLQYEFCGNSLASAASGFGRDVLDVKLEALLRQWHSSSDVLYAVHPFDGSLLVWTLESLDDPRRTPTLSFSSRLPRV